jgi:hypothetical protein
MDNKGKNFYTCKECGEAYEFLEHFHKHLRKHSITQAAYYQKHHPRYDLYNNEIIKFKDREYYFNNDFNNKNHLRWWLAKQTESKKKSWCKEALSKRKRTKELEYTPTQVELRTIMIPAANYLNELFGDYYGVCKELGFKNKYQNINSPLETQPIDPERKIIVDTRERQPLSFINFDTTRIKLDEGDYALDDDTITHKCRIERKSLADLYGTISRAGYDRFIREIERAETRKINFIVLVEAPLSDLYSFKYQRILSGKVKASPDFIAHRIREIIQKYPFVQFLFVKDRSESTRIIETIFKSQGKYRFVDLQLCYDTGLL